jgi:hypothetical protein
MCKLSKLPVAEPTLAPGRTVRNSAYELGSALLLRWTVEISLTDPEQVAECFGLGTTPPPRTDGTLGAPRPFPRMLSRAPEAWLTCRWVRT